MKIVSAMIVAPVGPITVLSASDATRGDAAISAGDSRYMYAMFVIA